MNALLQTLRNLGPVRLAVLGGVAVALIAFFIYLMTRMGGQDMGLLYGNLEQQDAAHITQRLQALNISYKVSTDGSQVFVPTEQVPQVRLTLAADGLPSGGSVGYEIFDRSQGLAASSFVQNINQLRALEGELARTIGVIDSVQSARVHLVLPQRELFSRDRQEPTAAIMLKMTGLKRLDNSQVQAIQNLVAAAVPGLKPDKVSIVDERGRLYSRSLNGGTDGAALATAEEKRITYENKLRDSVQTLLEQTLGQGKVRAEVAVEMDYSRTQVSQETYDPDQQVVRSTQSVNDSSENREGDQPSVTIANNLPPGAAQQSNGSPNVSRTSHSEETVNNEISRTVKNSTFEPGGIKRLSVAVLVDGRVTNGTWAPLPDAELSDIKRLVSSAVGFDVARHDQIEVVSRQFAALGEEGSTKPIQWFGLDKQELIKLAEILVLGAVGALVLLLVVRPLIGRVFETMPQAATAGGPAGLLGYAGGPAALPGPEGMGLMEQASAVEIADPIEEMIDLNRIEGRVKASSLRRIGDIVEKHPEEVVAILRNWLYQES